MKYFLDGRLIFLPSETILTFQKLHNCTWKGLKNLSVSLSTTLVLGLDVMPSYTNDFTLDFHASIGKLRGFPRYKDLFLLTYNLG